MRRGTSGRDDALKRCLRLPVLQSEAAQRMQNTETDAITVDNVNCKYHDVFYTKRTPPCTLVENFYREISWGTADIMRFTATATTWSHACHAT